MPRVLSFASARLLVRNYTWIQLFIFVVFSPKVAFHCLLINSAY